VSGSEVFAISVCAWQLQHAVRKERNSSSMTTVELRRLI